MDRGPEEIRAHYVDSMGSGLGEMHFALYNDIVWLHGKWRLYRQLFADSPERLESLNAAAGFAFFVIQDVLWHDTILHIARLVDSARSVGRDNLCLSQLVAAIDDPILRQDCEATLQEVVGACAFAREWRHKRLAHRDLQHALALDIDALPGVSRADVEAALASIRDLMNRLERHYRDAAVGYEHSVFGPGDGEALAYYLKRGLHADRQWEARVLAGEVTPEEFSRYESEV